MNQENKPEAAPPPRLSEELHSLQIHFAGQELCLGDVVIHLKGRAYLLLVILISLPFLTPIPLPGLSTPFGAIIALIALRLSLGQKPWLPEWASKRRIPPGLFLKVLTITTRIVGWLERFLRPRLSWLVEGAPLRFCHCLLMLLAAAALMLPLPIPFTNTIPAWVILLVAGGFLEKDGMAIVLAYIVFALGVLYFVFLGEAANQLIRRLLEWLQ